MTPDQIEAERVAFEAWGKSKGWRPHAFRRQSDNGEYFYGSSFHAWHGWLARAELIHAEQATKRGHDATTQTD